MESYSRLPIIGAAAHDDPVAGAPLLAGGRASTAVPTPVSADGDAVRAWLRRTGAQVVALVDSAGADLIKFEDDASVSGDGGIPILAIRNDALGSLAGSDLDYGTLQLTSTGALRGEVSGLQAADAVLTAKPLVAGGRASSAIPTAMSADGDVVQAWLDRTGAQVVNGRDAIDAAIDALTKPMLSGGRASAAAPADVSADGDAVASWLKRSGAAVIEGGVAHDAVDAGDPVKIGAQARNALPTAAASADRVNMIADLFGRLLVGHIDPAMQVHINKTYTGQQTGSDLWDPTAGKRIAVTSLIIAAYGTVAGRIILWFGDNADTTFTQDSDQVLAAVSFAPSATVKPGLVYSPATPVFCTTADRELHVTTDAGISFDVTIEGYEW